jgi:hypothetical protein
VRGLPIWFLVDDVLEGRLDRDELVHRLAELGPDERIGVVEDLLADAYGLAWNRDPRGVSDGWLDRARDHRERLIFVEAAIGASGGAAAVEHADRRLREKLRADPALVWGMVLARAGRFTPEHEGAVRLAEAPASTFVGPLRELLAALPVDRREALLVNVPGHRYVGDVSAAGTYYRWTAGRAWAFLDLCSALTITRRVTEELDEWERWRADPGTRPGEKLAGTTRTDLAHSEPDPFPFERARELARVAGNDVLLARTSRSPR